MIWGLTVKMVSRLFRTVSLLVIDALIWSPVERADIIAPDWSVDRSIQLLLVTNVQEGRRVVDTGPENREHFASEAVYSVRYVQHTLYTYDEARNCRVQATPGYIWLSWGKHTEKQPGTVVQGR